MEKMFRIRFTSAHFGNTAALVVPASKLKKGVSYLSHLYPTSQAMKMERFEFWGPFEDFNEACAYPEPVNLPDGVGYCSNRVNPVKHAGFAR